MGTTINHDTFKQIISYKPAVTGTEARNHLKMEMLNTVITAIGEKWTRMKSETRSSLEYLCFLAIERGFVYAGSEHVGERYEIDSSTVRRYLCQLEKQGVIKRKWRSSVKRNSRGQAIIFFTIHPYYATYWGSKFFYTPDTQENAQVESVEAPTRSKENEINEVSTISQPNIFKSFNKRNKGLLSSEFTSDRVPEEFTKLASCFWDDFRIIEKLWSKVNIVSWKYCFENDKGLILGVGLDALKQTVRSLKVKTIRDKFSYFYGVLMKKFEHEYFAELDELGRV